MLPRISITRFSRARNAAGRAEGAQDDDEDEDDGDDDAGRVDLAPPRFAWPI